MIITRKAIVGFVLLAILTFSVSTISYQNRIEMPKSVAHIDGTDKIVSPYKTNAPDTVVVYTNQGINAGEYTPIGMTALIELITMVGYIGLKRVEPRIKAWEERVRVRNPNGGK
jgi:hypothetical protein